MLTKAFIKKYYLKATKYTFSSFSKFRSQIINKKKGNLYIKSTKRNLFCTLIDIEKKKVNTSCSLRVVDYVNEFNQREDLYDRGILLGKLLEDKAFKLGFKEIAIFFSPGLDKARKGVLFGFSKKRIKISFIQFSKALPHNGCRPSKMRRKKLRTKPRNR